MAKKEKFNTITGKKKTDKQVDSGILAIRNQLKAGQDSIVESGRFYDDKVIKESATGVEDKYEAIEAYYPSVTADYFDPYEDYIPSQTLRSGQYGIDELNLRRAEEQSNWEQAGNAIKRVGVNIIPQIISGFSSMLDVPGYFDAEEAANNSIVNWANDIQEWSQEAMPIYEEAPGESMQMGDFAWWMSRGEGLVTSIGAFMAQGMGAGKLVSWGLKGLGSASKGKDLTRAVLGSTAPKALRGAQGAERSKRFLGATEMLTTSVMLNQSEAVMEATSVYNDTFKNSFEKGMSYEKSKKNAARGAATTMNLNRINILLNLSSAKAFLSPKSFSRQLIKQPSLLKSLGLTAVEGGQEAMEELINHVASKAGMAEGEGKDYTFRNALDDMGTMEGFEAAFLGALGGMGQTGGTKLLQRNKYGAGSTKDEDGNRVSYVQDQRNKYEKQQEIIEELKTQGVNVTDAMGGVKDYILFTEKIKAAAANNDQAEVDVLLSQMFENQAFKAFESGTTEILEQLYEEEAAKDPNEVGQEHVDNAKQALKDLQVLESTYVNHEDLANKDDVFKNRANKLRINRIVSEQESKQLSNENELSKLIKDIASDYEVSRDRDVIYKEEGTEVRRETITENKPLSYNTHDLENNPEDTAANKATYEKFLAEVQQLPQYTIDVANKETLRTLRKEAVNIEKEYTNLTSEKVQAEATAKNTKKAAVKEATSKLKDLTSISKIKNLKEKINDTAFSKLADEKIAKINTEKEAIATSKKKAEKAAKISTKIKNTKEKDLKDKKVILALRKEITDAEISKESKEQLNTELDKRTSGEDVNDGIDLGSVFESITPEEQAARDAQEAAAKTKFPKDVPNPNTETKTVDAQTAESEKTTAKDSTRITEADGDTLIYSFDRFSEGHNLGAYLSRSFQQLSEMGVGSREEVTNALVEENKHLLDPEAFLAGTKLVIEVDTEYVGPKLDEASETKEKAADSWEVQEARLIEQATVEGKNHTTLDEYVDNVPIKVSTADGTVLFYLHDAGWIQSENIDNGTEEITLDREKLRAIRRTVIESPKGVESKINYKSNGKLFKTADGQKIDVSEAMPDSDLIFAIGKEGASSSAIEFDYSVPSDQLKGKGKESVIVNSFEPKAGAVYAIVPIGVDSDGDLKSIPIALERKPLSEDIKYSIITAIKLYLEGDAKNKTVKDILVESGVDITTIDGLRDYVKQFVYLVDVDNKTGLSPFLNIDTDTINSALGLMTITGNNIQFGRPTVNYSGKKQAEKAGTISKNFKTGNEDAIIRLESVLDYMLSNVNREMLQKSTSKAILIGTDGELITSTYKEHIKNTHTTEFISANIGTEESPKWVYTVQPTFTFDTTPFNKELKKVNKPKNKLTKKQVAKKVKKITKKSTPQVKKVEVQPTSEVEDLRTSNQLEQSTIEDKVAEEATAATEEQEAQGVAEGTEVSAIEQTLEVLELSKTSDEKLPGIDNAEDLEAVIRIYTRALEIKNTDVDKFSWGDGLTFSTDASTTDGTTFSNEIEEDNETGNEEETEDFIPTPTEQQNKDINEALKDSVILNVNPKETNAAIEYLSSIIFERSLKQKEATGNSTIPLKPIYDNYLIQLGRLRDYHEKKGWVNNTNTIQALIDQYPKLKKRVNEHLSLLSIGTVQEVEFDNNNEEQVGLVKTTYSEDAKFTINHKDKSSIDLKKFFSVIANRKANGENSHTPLLIPEMVNYDVVYNKVQEVLANKPADFDTMIEHLKLQQDNFPWMQSVVEKLKDSSVKIKNEFVSNMSKHSVEMQFIMWKKNKEGKYYLQNWSSNSSSVQKKLLQGWQSNLKGLGTQSNIVWSDDEGDYRFNIEVTKGLVKQANEWKKDPSQVTNDELASWLGNFGIVLSDETYVDLREGNYRNGGKKIVWDQLFKNKGSFIRVLSEQIKKLDETSILDDSNRFVTESAIKNLAKLDATNLSNVFSNSFNAGTKTVYSYGNNNYLMNRMRDLTATNSDGSFTNADLINDLKTISFTKDSKWLNELTGKDEKVREAMLSHFGTRYVSIEALKKMFTESKDNRKLSNLVAAEHEVAKINFFFNGSKFTDDNLKARRKVSFFYPTTSDKTTMMLMQALSQELNLDSDGSLSDENLESLYTSTVLPEINRIAGKKTETVAGYKPDVFYFFHDLNNLIIDFNGVDVTLKEAIQNKTENDPIIKNAVKDYLKGEVNQLVEKKLEEWNKLGIGITDSKANIENSFLDANYMSSVAKGDVRYAAADFIFNSLVANAEMHTMFIGDPAMYAKFSKVDKFIKIYNEQNPDSKITKETMTDEHHDLKLTYDLENTFINIGKRLAGDIAPGMELAGSQNNKYHQVFFEDTEMESNNVKDPVQLEYFSKIMKDYKKNYSGIEGSDAQEYTTWKEHVYVMKQLGRLTSQEYKKIVTKLTSQSKSGVRANNKLTYDQLGMILQPMKPVYVGNQASVNENIDRRIYIKSSSFPLIPQLTATMGIDSIRKSMETFETDNNSTVRASFGTANKVGAVNNAISVFNKDGSTKTDIKITEDNALLLERKNFRIQQDVPYNRDKSSVNIGTQARKLLFVNLLDVQIEDGVTGEQLKAEYDQYYKELFQDGQEKLKVKLGMVTLAAGDLDISNLLSIPETSIFDESSEGIELSEADQARKDFINDDANFQDIIEKLAQSKVNVFFQDENGVIKNCN